MKREELKYKMLDKGGYQGETKAYIKEEADSVMDAMEKQIRTLENDKEAMYEASLVQQARIKELEADAELDQKKRLMLCNGYKKKCERVKELEATISKMETTTPKWISVEDRLPDVSGDYQVVYQHKNGKIFATSFDEWDDDCQDWMNATDRVIVAFWAELLPPPPTTEEK